VNWSGKNYFCELMARSLPLNERDAKRGRTTTRVILFSAEETADDADGADNR
jgi:hypothetical protein